MAGAGLVHVRVCEPPPQVTEHAPQVVQPPLIGAGHAWLLQDCEVVPEHAAPPLAGAGAVQVRVWIPPPHATEHAPQPLQPPLTTAAQAVVLQVCVRTAGPEQVVPPPEGGGLVQLRELVCVPPPQLTEHALQALQPVQPPFTAIMVLAVPGSVSSVASARLVTNSLQRMSVVRTA